MQDKLFSVENRVCIVTGGLGQLGVQYVKALHDRGQRLQCLESIWNRKGWRML